MKKYRNLFQEMRDFRKEFIIGPTAKLFEAVLEVMLPILMVRLVNSTLPSGSRATTVQIALIMIGMAFMGVCAAVICQYCAARACSGVSRNLRDRLMTKVNSFTVAQQEKCGVSYLGVAMTSDVNQVSLGVSMFIRLVFRVPFITIAGVLSAMSIDAPLSGVIAVGAAMFLLTLLLIIRVTFKKYKVVQKKLDHISRVVNERLSGIRVIRAFSREKHHEELTDEAAGAYAQEAISVSRYASLMRPLTILLTNFAVVFILWVGGYRINVGRITGVQLFAFIQYIFTIFDALNILGNLVVIFSRSFVSAERIEGILEIEPDTRVIEASEKDMLHDDKAIVKWKDVSFSYLQDKEDKEEYYALRDVSFELRKGEKLGVIGTTGSGKSTIVSLMLKLYDTTKGNIYIDGRPITSINETELRRRMSPVFQTTVLFAGTIRENLLLGNPEGLSDEEIAERCRAAQAWDFIEEKGGLDAIVEPRGKNFSGGQKQRLSIARALCAEGDILLLDDASAALDKDTSARLQEALKLHKEKTSRTMLEISSKISEIMDSDWIIVLDNGMVVGQGKHDDLLKECDAYAKIARSQEMGGVEG